MLMMMDSWDGKKHEESLGVYNHGFLDRGDSYLKVPSEG
jgi:hypothetical protein